MSSTNTSASMNAVTPNAATANSARRKSLLIAGQPAQRLQPLGIELPDVACEVCQREIAEVLDERRDLGLGAGLEVLLARERGRVDVEAAGAPAHEHALRVEPGHHGEQRRVRAHLASAC